MLIWIVCEQDFYVSLFRWNQALNLVVTFWPIHTCAHTPHPTCHTTPHHMTRHDTTWHGIDMDIDIDTTPRWHWHHITQHHITPHQYQNHTPHTERTHALTHIHHWFVIDRFLYSCIYFVPFFHEAKLCGVLSCVWQIMVCHRLKTVAEQCFKPNFKKHQMVTKSMSDVKYCIPWFLMIWYTGIQSTVNPNRGTC
jgi:hypothetical protein